jgi:NTE family protein
MTTTKLHSADAVFEGGGVKGIAFLGALGIMERLWSWENVAGTSAGAIVAAFTAVGMSSQEVARVLDRVQLQELMDVNWEDKIDRLFSSVSILSGMPGVGVLRKHAFSILKDFGIYEGNRFIDLINENLPADTLTFGNLLYDAKAAKDSPYRYKLRVVASDVTANRMLILPQDIRYFGIDPDTLSIAEALRMSMSIPIFFEPWKLKDRKGRTHYIVDGGILSNYPIWMFDAPVGEEPSWPTFGFDLFIPGNQMDGHLPFPEDVAETNNVLEFARGVWNTLFSAMDCRYIAKRHWARTIAIDNLNIPTTQFDLSKTDRERLWESGARAAQSFMEKWGDPEEGFAHWKLKYRGEVEMAQQLALDAGLKR